MPRFGCHREVTDMRNRRSIRSTRISLLAAAAAATPLAGISPLAFAQAVAAESAASAPSADAKLDTVMVTARKREERGQDVPQSLNVFSGAALEAAGVTTFDQLQYRTPGVATVNGPGNQIAIRGVSNNASARGGGPSTAVHFDGVYLPRPEMAFTELFDLARVEVLKGPEGTLYGRNATAGVVNYVSRDPDRTTGFDGFVGGGSYGLVRGQAGVNVGSGEVAGFRISAAAAKDDGYTKNLNSAGGHIDARDVKAARAKGVFQFSPNVEAKVTFQLVDDKGTVGFGISGNPATANYVNSLHPPLRENPGHINVDTPPDVGRRGALMSAQVSADLGGGIQLKSITGYVRFTSHVLTDGDGSGGFIENNQNADKSNFWSQEIQLSGGSPTGVSWITGVYASHERTSGDSLTYDSNNYPTDLSTFVYSSQDYGATDRSLAAFGEVTYAMSNQWSITAGGRYTRERISGSSTGEQIDFATFNEIPYAGSESVTSGRFTPKLLLQYKPGRDQLVYASVTEGFKTGGINFFPPIKTYRPEKITAYEVGGKTLMADGKIELDGAVFYYDYTDLQLRTVVGKTAPISNVSKASIQGVEAAVVARPVRDLSLDLNAAYVDSELKEYISPATGTDLSGMRLPLSPRLSSTGGAQYRFPLAARLVPDRPRRSQLPEQHHLSRSAGAGHRASRLHHARQCLPSLPLRRQQDLPLAHRSKPDRPQLPVESQLLGRVCRLRDLRGAADFRSSPWDEVLRVS